jgi:hypothetical protein
VPRDAVPDEPDLAPLFRIYAVLLLARGTQVTAADVHNAWAAWMLGHNAHHEQLKPFDQLDVDVAARDDRYVEAIRRVATRRKADNAGDTAVV